MATQPTVFLGFLDICGLYWALRSGLQEAGARVYFLDLGEDTFGYRQFQRQRFVPEYFFRSYREYIDASDVRWWHPSHALRLSRLALATSMLAIWMVSRFNVFVINAGQSIAGGTALFSFLRLFRKTIVFPFHGSSSRPPFLNPVIGIPVAELAQLTADRRVFVDQVTEFADFVIENPLSGQFQSKRCCTYQYFFNSKTVPLVTNRENTDEEGDIEARNGKIKILHAPSFPELKGTAIVRATVVKLQDEGYEIDYVELTGVSNETVLREIGSCELVIDELYSDIHGAVFALEAAVQGKPVLVCGYGGEELARFVGPEAIFPTHYCPPEDFEVGLRRLLDDAAYRKDLGDRARAYARGWASPRESAERLLRLVSGNAPDEWFFDPCDIRYIHGVGGTKDRVRAQIRRLLEHGGEDALCLPDKPELRKKLMEFASSK